MSRTRLAVGFALAAYSLFSGTACAADFRAVGPVAPAASLLAARPALHEPALEFVYALTGGETPGTMTVDLAADFIAVREGRTTQIYDFALRRILLVDNSAHAFTNGSLYGFNDFRVAETFNRRYQYRLLRRAGVGDAAETMAPFWVQSEIHLMDPQDGVPDVAQSEDGGVVRFSYKGKAVVTFASSQTALTSAQGAMFAKFLALRSWVHPLIARQIAEAGHLPQHLTYAFGAMLKKPDAQWKLQSAATVEAVYPLASSDRADVASDTTGPPLDTVLPLMLSAVANKAPGLHSAAEFRAAIEKAMADGKPFQAALTTLEFTEQYGQQAADCAGAADCHSMKAVFVAAQADPRTAILLAALQPGRDQMNQAIQNLRSIKREDLSNPYVLDDFLANLLVESGHGGDATPLFVKAVKGNPYMAGYYKDIGDMFRFSFDPGDAWLCYDLGRALPGGAEVPPLAKMSDYERDLVTRYPEFF